MEIIRDLRLGEFDVLVGINLLREGLDIPEIALVTILDADKEADIQTIIDKLTETMLKYAEEMEFEKAAEIRDKIKELTK